MIKIIREDNGRFLALRDSGAVFWTEREDAELFVKAFGYPLEVGMDVDETKRPEPKSDQLSGSHESQLDSEGNAISVTPTPVELHLL